MTETTTPLPPPQPTESFDTGADAAAAVPESQSTEAAELHTEPEALPTQRERVRDPQLSVLQGMFPDFDESVLQSVLDSVGGNSDRAIDVLLGMNDPEYRSDARPQEEEPVLSQEELDARLARQLYMEDQQQQDAAWQAQQQQPRPRPTFSGRRQTQPEPERDTMTEIGDQFSKIAESGKKTFGNIFSKVKAKIQEFDQSRQEGPSGVGGDTYPYEAGQSPYPTAQQNRHQRMQQQLQEHQARLQQNQQPAYYDPNTTSESPPPSAGGYDAMPSSRANPVSEPTTPRSPPPSSGIDAGKLGLLPKRPVSLLRAQSPTTADHPPADGAPGHPTKISTGQASPPVPAMRHDSDANDIYVDDPFEDEHQVEAETGTAESVSK
ncbi:hypothetical protein BT96DRAFT_1024856 [Gymnopus androsaceus JB14]|uniref:CUE domain-containing protein n=1 Tax=Gymnopus androsaceus JB14 TaxID=1447944 RepID=A0A6A4GWT0_9AGAR|nr:hypothetical protein BT96DRAFT_1024856 [Gymnopus androsaceus JB14]